MFLRDEIKRHFKEVRKVPVNLKYIDPSYTIRSAPADADDSVFCFQLGENAVHAAMAGRTAMLVSQLNGKFVHIPLKKAVEKRYAKEKASGTFKGCSSYNDFREILGREMSMLDQEAEDLEPPIELGGQR